MDDLPWRNTTSHGPFVHQKLDTTQQCIRLFRVDNHEDGILGHIEHFTFDSLPQFRALSYTWGPKEDLRQICIGGSAFQIRRNLYEFLRRYKDRHVGEWLWVDQICIDQAVITERNHQVQLMSMIYSQACEVIIWLNLEGSPKIDFLNCHDEASHATSYCEIHRRAILYLADHQYWSRVWIIQEVVLARSRVVWWLDETLSWAAFETYFRAKGFSLSNLLQLADSSPAHLEIVLMHLKDCVCENPRDMLYGVQSILLPEQQQQIDYLRSTEQVFVDGAVVLMKSRRRLATMLGEAFCTLARSMGVHSWSRRGPEPYNAIIRLADARKEKDASYHWHEVEWHAGFMHLTREYPQPFKDWFKKHAEQVQFVMTTTEQRLFEEALPC